MDSSSSSIAVAKCGQPVGLVCYGTPYRVRVIDCPNKMLTCRVHLRKFVYRPSGGPGIQAPFLYRPASGK